MHVNLFFGKMQTSNKRKTLTYSAEHKHTFFFQTCISFSFWATLCKFQHNKMWLILFVWVWSSHSWYNLHFSLGLSLSLPGQRDYMCPTSSVYIITDYMRLHNSHMYLLNPKIIHLTCGESQHISVVCLMTDTETD